MENDLLKNLIYISQVSLFAGIALIIFAWVEKKPWVEIIGQLIFVALGLLAAWVIVSGQLVVTEPVDGSVTKEMRTMLYLFGLIVTSVTALAAFILRLIKSKIAVWLNVVLVIAALLLFFMVYQLITK